jgi:methylaspartate mutase epsilon subunit
MEANAQGLRCTKQVVNMLADQTFSDVRLDAEKEIIRLETRAIVDKCFELGNGDIAVGVCRGVAAGVLDVPFAPCRANAGIMLPCRDNDGAVRILKTGNLPFSKELIDFHAKKIDERAKAEKREASFQMVVDDVYAIGKGRLVGRPKY